MRSRSWESGARCSGSPPRPATCSRSCSGLFGKEESMWLVLTALRRPITILVAVISIALCSYLAVRRMKVDIFPNLGSPAIFVAQPYGGMDPAQMEGYLSRVHAAVWLRDENCRGRSEEHTSELQSQSNLVCRLL